MRNVCICGKSFKTHSGLLTHQRACIEFNKDLAPFCCICGYSAPTPQHLYEHRKYCKVYCDTNHLEVRNPKLDKYNDNRGWNRGLNKLDPIYGSSIQRSAEGARKYLLSLGDNNPLFKWYETASDEDIKHKLQKQSNTMKQQYADGSRVPHIGIGKGITFGLDIGDKTLFVRSSSEFIFALYLVDNHINFDYENIHVSYKGHTYFNDFYINDTVIEIKSFKSDKELTEKEAFISFGYIFKVIYDDEIDRYRYQLCSKFDIEYLLVSAYESDRLSSKYLVFNPESKEIRFIEKNSVHDNESNNTSS